MKSGTRIITNILIISVLLQFNLFGQLRLPRLISDGMVLQRNSEIIIWGWATPGEKVTVKFSDAAYTANANNNGEWNVSLPAKKAGGPFSMIVSAGDTIKIKDIMIGDVWICSGQSNMELNMQRVNPLYGKEIAASENPLIRYFEVPDIYNFVGAQKDLQGGKWESANPENLLHFSAVSYFFGKELFDTYNVPIGLINSALGGSPISCWISEEGLKEFPHYYKEALKFKDSTLIRRIREDDGVRIENWYDVLKLKDEGYSNPELPWYSPEYDASDWRTMNIPGYWTNENPGFKNGVVWFRNEFEVPPTMIGVESDLNLGTIVDADSVYVNGAFIGTTSYQYPPRRYKIPSGILREGKNIIVVRVINSWGKGGFTRDKSYEIVAGDTTIDLAGEWQFKLGASMEPLKGQTFIRWKPLGLYNAMIAPLTNYSIKGFAWYQGESDAGRPMEYRETLPALIHDWRDKWNQGEIPFLIVQLPNFMEANSVPSESNWALMRESQLKTLSVPNTGLVVTIDIGEWNDIHPLNKKDVGKRLALSARKVAYGEKDIVYSGPLYESMRIENNKIILSLTNTGSGLMAKGSDELKGFAICGKDRKFVWANAEIRGNKVVVWSDEILNPVAVRYAWADNPVGANLFNTEGLPASPFRTDEF